MLLHAECFLCDESFVAHARHVPIRLAVNHNNVSFLPADADAAHFIYQFFNQQYSPGLYTNLKCTHPEKLKPSMDWQGICTFQLSTTHTKTITMPFAYRTLPIAFSVLCILLSCHIKKDSTAASGPGDLSPVLAGTPKITQKTLLTGYDISWGMDFLPNGDLLFGEKKGTLYMRRGETITPVTGFPAVRPDGQGGLLDIRVHPDYATNGWIYASYSTTSANKNGELRLARFRIVNNTVQNFEMLFTTGGGNLFNGHYGSRIAFDTKKMLYLSIGEGGSTTWGGTNPENQNASNTNVSWGKVHRMNDNGTVPSDNPVLPGNTAPTTIFSYGHRNPQGLALNPTTGAIWQTEHGPQGGDEINIINKGANYGWPFYSYGVNYGGSVISSGHTANGITEPIYHWTPSIGTCGMAFITSNKFRDWKGNLLVSGLASKKLYRCTISNNTVTNVSVLLENEGRVRNVQQAPDGSVYVSVEGPGRIIQLIPE